MNGKKDDELDIDEFYERHKEAIEAANERIHKDMTEAPEGYYTLAEFNELFHKKFDDCYAELRKDQKGDNSKNVKRNELVLQFGTGFLFL